MKKIFVIALAAMSMTLVSCKKNVEDKAISYFEQMMEAEKAGDSDKAAKISAEAEEWMKGLSPEDQAKCKAAVEKKMMEEVQKQLGLSDEEMKKMKEEGGTLEGMEEEADEAVEAIEEAADEAVEEIEEAAEAL